MQLTGMPIARWNPSRWMDARRLRRAQELLDGEQRRARVVCVASGKGGTGKSVTASNLAVLRAERGERVCLIDFDAGLANDHLLLGLAPTHDLGHVLEGSVAPEDALIEGPLGVQLLSGGVGRHALASPTRRELDRLFRALEPLERAFDLILIDHGAGLGYALAAHLAATTSLLLVTHPEVTALSDAYATYKRAVQVNPGLRAGLVVNRASDAERAGDAWRRFHGVSMRFLNSSPEYVGWVQDDPSVGRSVETRRPVALGEPDSPAARSLRDVAHWSALDLPANGSSFYDRARRALR